MDAVRRRGWDEGEKEVMGGVLGGESAEKKKFGKGEKEEREFSEADEAAENDGS